MFQLTTKKNFAVTTVPTSTENVIETAEKDTRRRKWREEN